MLLLKVEEETFIKRIRAGDIGIIRGRTVFGKLQNLFRKRFKEGPLTASHGFLVKDPPPQISEANGVCVSGNTTFLKNIGNNTEAWFFRYSKMTPENLEKMLIYARSAEETKGHYSWGGIWEFAQAFFTGKPGKMEDKPGVFCTEYTSRAIQAGGFGGDYITEVPPQRVDPSYQLNWMMGDEARAKGWILAGYYDAKGGYYLPAEAMAA